MNHDHLNIDAAVECVQKLKAGWVPAGGMIGVPTHWVMGRVKVRITTAQQDVLRASSTYRAPLPKTSPDGRRRMRDR